MKLSKERGRREKKEKKERERKGLNSKSTLVQSWKKSSQ